MNFVVEDFEGCIYVLDVYYNDIPENVDDDFEDIGVSILIQVKDDII